MPEPEQAATPIPPADLATLWEGYCAWLDERESDEDDDTLQ